MTAQESDIELRLTCDLCGVRPACMCSLDKVEGRAFFYRTTTAVRPLCAACTKWLYADYTRFTLVAGWWSLNGWFRTPTTVIMNTCECIGCLIKLRKLTKRMRAMKASTPSHPQLPG